MTNPEQDKTKQIDTIKVAALTGGVNTPSSRFRIRQYTNRLKDKGVIIQEHIPYFEKSCGLPSPFKAAARIPGLIHSRKADLVWVGKELVKGYQTFESLLKRPRVLDVDDAIWLSKPFGKIAASSIARSMDAVIAGNTYLAEYFSEYNKNIHIIPTAIDLDRYRPRPEENANRTDKFIIGWTGLACNYKYLKLIERPLKKFLDDHKDAQLMLVSNRPWSPELIDPKKITFIQWTKENEATCLHDMSVGIMPLTDNKWARGKCSFKMLQYMAAALPVIVSPVGMNADILQKANIGFGPTNDDQWYDALKTLYDDHPLQIDMAATGRRIVEENYNADAIADQLAGIFRTLCGK
jgi:glycosyltransferase involved in cell wall biosynthesis